MLCYKVGILSHYWRKFVVEIIRKANHGRAKKTLNSYYICPKIKGIFLQTTNWVKDKTLDLALKIFALTFVPIEVQIHGIISDLIYRLSLVHQWTLKMVIVADEEWHD